MHVLVTGAAGFIGFHLSKRLIAEGHTVVGIDNLNDYYSVQLKKIASRSCRPCPASPSNIRTSPTTPRWKPYSAATRSRMS